MTEQDSTVRDIVIGIVSSILATILYHLGSRGVLSIRSKRFRKARARLVKDVLTIGLVVFRKFSAGQLRTGAYGLMALLTAVIFLSHGPKIATDDVVTQMTPSNEALVRLGEVWERIDENELIIETLLVDSLIESRNPNKDSSANDERADKIRHLFEQDLAIVSKNRFWLGEKNYKKTRKYLDIYVEYALNKLLVFSPDSSEINKKTEQAKQDIFGVELAVRSGRRFRTMLEPPSPCSFVVGRTEEPIYYDVCEHENKHITDNMLRET